KLCPVPTQPVPILIGGHSEPALKRAALRGDGWIGAGSTLDQLKVMIGKMQQYRREYGREQLPFDIQAMTQEAYTPDGIKRLADLGVTEVLVGFRNAYAGGPDHRTLEQMIGELKHYADTVIAASR